jgi:hypothetical protein
MAKIIIPNVVGLSREDAEKKLDAAHMRYRGPAAGTEQTSPCDHTEPCCRNGGGRVNHRHGDLPVHRWSASRLRFAGRGARNFAGEDRHAWRGPEGGRIRRSSHYRCGPRGPCSVRLRYCTPDRGMGEAGRGAGLGPKRDGERSRRHGCRGKRPESSGLRSRRCRTRTRPWRPLRGCRGSGCRGAGGTRRRSAPRWARRRDADGLHVASLREMNVTPHVAQNDTNRFLGELCGNLGDAVIRRRSAVACWRPRRHHGR